LKNKTLEYLQGQGIESVDEDITKFLEEADDKISGGWSG
jgi:hypothetical protein